MALERLLGLDHCPVAAVGEHVQFGIGDGAHRNQRHVQRADPVVATPCQQRWRRPCASSPRAAARRSCIAPSSARTPPCRTSAGRSPGPRIGGQRPALLDQFLGHQRLVVDHRCSQSISRWRVGSSVNSRSRLMPSLGPGTEDVRADAADRDEAADTGRAGGSRNGADAATHRIADDVDASPVPRASRKVTTPMAVSIGCPPKSSLTPKPGNSRIRQRKCSAKVREDAAEVAPAGDARTRAV